MGEKTLSFLRLARRLQTLLLSSFPILKIGALSGGSGLISTESPNVGGG
jgi:hypothetical protein